MSLEDSLQGYTVVNPDRGSRFIRPAARHVLGKPLGVAEWDG